MIDIAALAAPAPTAPSGADLADAGTTEEFAAALASAIGAEGDASPEAGPDAASVADPEVGDALTSMLGRPATDAPDPSEARDAGVPVALTAEETVDVDIETPVEMPMAESSSESGTDSTATPVPTTDGAPEQAPVAGDVDVPEDLETPIEADTPADVEARVDAEAPAEVRVRAGTTPLETASAPTVPAGPPAESTDVSPPVPVELPAAGEGESAESLSSPNDPIVRVATATLSTPAGGDAHQSAPTPAAGTAPVADAVPSQDTPTAPTVAAAASAAPAPDDAVAPAGETALPAETAAPTDAQPAVPVAADRTPPTIPAPSGTTEHAAPAETPTTDADVAPTLAPATPRADAPAADVSNPSVTRAAVSAVDAAGTATPTTAAAAAAPSPTPATAPTAPAAAPAEAPAMPQAEVETSPTQQVAEALRAVRRLTDGSHRLSLQLHPQELGAVQLEIAVRDGRLHVHAVAETDAARQALEQGMPELRSELREAGVTAGSLEVGPDASGDRRARAESDDARTFARREDRPADVDDTPASTPDPVTADGAVDLRL